MVVTVHCRLPRRCALALTLAAASATFPLLPVHAQSAAVNPQLPASTRAPLASPVLARTADGASQVTRDDVLAEARRMPEASRARLFSNPENVARAAEGLLLQRLMSRQAVAQGMDARPEVQVELTQARDRVLSEAYLRQLEASVNPGPQALEQAARTQYQASPEKFAQPAQNRVRHILLDKNAADAMDRAQALLARLRAGESFEALAKSESIDPGSAAKGGDLGFFGPGKMIKPFEDAVAALQQPGDLSPVVETRFGLHIIRLEERRPAGTQPFDDVKDRLMASILTTLQRTHRDQAFDEQRKLIEVNAAAQQDLAREFAELANTAATAATAATAPNTARPK